MNKGDVVYLERSISIGWNSKERFYIPAKIERTTKTQVIIDGKRFNKESQKEVGGHGYSRASFYLLGQSDYGKIVKDETIEFNDFRKKRKVWMNLNNIIDDIPSVKIESSIETLQEIETKINDIISLIKGEK